MTEWVKEIYRRIKEKNPQYSEKEIEGATRVEMYQQASIHAKKERRNVDTSTTEFNKKYMPIWEDLSDSGMSEAAERIAKNIKKYKDASNAKQEALMSIDSHLTELKTQKETAKEAGDVTTKKLKWLSEDANDV